MNGVKLPYYSIVLVIRLRRVGFGKTHFSQTKVNWPFVSVVSIAIPTIEIEFIESCPLKTSSALKFSSLFIHAFAPLVPHAARPHPLRAPLPLPSPPDTLPPLSRPVPPTRSTHAPAPLTPARPAPRPLRLPDHE